jgi:hypothetical protein
MDSRLSQQLIAIRETEAIERATAARAARPRRIRLTLPHTVAMIGVWRAGSRAR